jgi:hypothetical protein
MQLECRWCVAVCREVWPRTGAKWVGSWWIVIGVRAHNRGESSSLAKQRGWLLVRYGLLETGEGEDGRYVGLDELDQVRYG